MNHRVWSAVASVVCTIAAAVPLAAQGAGFGIAGGSIGQRVTYDYQYSDTGSGPQRHAWIRSIVLWRGQPEWGHGKSLDTAASNAAQHAWRVEMFNASDSGRSVMGGVNGSVAYTAELDRDGATLRILGRSYAVPARDSMLVVMVDRIDSVGGAPYVAGVTYVNAVVPENFWPRVWMRGDTTLVLRRHHRNELLATVLRSSPVVAAFLP